MRGKVASAPCPQPRAICAGQGLWTPPGPGCFLLKLGSFPERLFPSAWRSVYRQGTQKLSFDFSTGKGFPISGNWKVKAGVWLSCRSAAPHAQSPGLDRQQSTNWVQRCTRVIPTLVE